MADQVFLTGNQTFTGPPFPPTDDFIITDNGVGSNTVTLANGINHLTLGSGGNNTITLGNGADLVNVGGGSNTVTTGNGNSSITTAAGSNTITVGTGSNTITLGESASGSPDTVSTQAGDNIVLVAGAAVSGDTIHGALGTADGSTNQLVLTTPGAAMNPANVYGFQSYQLANGGPNGLTLSEGNFTNLPAGSITVTGGDSGNTVNAAALSAAHSVVIYGGSGLDMLTGGAGNDRFVFMPSNLTGDTADGGSGNNTLELAAGAGTGTLSGLGTSFVNLQTVMVDLNADWVFSAGSNPTNESILLGSNSIAEFQGSLASSDTIGFAANTGELKIGQPSLFAAAIMAFQQGDTIDDAVIASSYSYLGGILSLNNNGVTVAQMTVSTPYVNPHFTLAGDSNGGTLVGVAPGDVPPMAVVPGAAYSAVEQTNLSLQGSGLSVSDADAGSGSETVTLSAGEGTITVAAGTSGITGLADNGTGSVSFSGTIAQLNALLGGSSSGTVVYDDNTDTPSASTALTLAIDDNGNTGPGGPLIATASQTISIIAVDDAPAVSAPGSYSGTPNVAFAVNGIDFSDVDSAGGVELATFSVTGGTLTATSAGGVTAGGSGGHTVTLSGTLSNLNSFISNNLLQFSGPGNDTLSVTIDDQGHTGTGGPLSTGTSAPIILNQPPVVTAISQNVTAGQPVAFSPNIFTVAGSGITQYQVIVDNPAGGVPADGTVTDNGNPVPLGTVITDSSLGGLQFTGGASPGQDFLILRAFNGAWSDWTTAVITDQGGASPAPPVVTAISQTVAASQPVAFSPNIFTVAGSGITQYQVIVDNPAGGVPADGTVTDNGNPVPLGTVITDSSLGGLQFTGGASPGQDFLILRAFNGAWSDWTTAVITDQGGAPPAPPVVTAISQTVAAGQPVAFSPNVFTVAGSGITQYQVIVDNPAAGVPADGTVTDNSNPVPLGTLIPETSLGGLQFTGGASPGQDFLILRAFNGAWSDWATAVITDQGAPVMTAADRTGPLPGIVAAGSGANLIALGPNQTFQDGSAIYTDTVVGFDATGGDRIGLTTDTVANALAHTAQVNSSQDTMITLADTSTILLKGVNHIDASMFA